MRTNRNQIHELEVKKKITSRPIRINSALQSRVRHFGAGIQGRAAWGWDFKFLGWRVLCWRPLRIGRYARQSHLLPEVQTELRINSLCVHYRSAEMQEQDYLNESGK